MRVVIESMGDSIELPVGETLVGRDVACGLRFNDPALSRRHLKLIRRQDEVLVEDLRSSNGTRLNGRSIAGATRVSDGDVIGIGTRELIVRIGERDAEQPSTLVLQRRTLEPVPTFVTARLPVTKPPPFAPEGTPVHHRRHDRHPVELSLVYVSSELEIEATTRDLSQSGVFVCSQLLDPVGTRCQLTLLVDGGPPLQIRGIVRRVVERDDEGDEPVGLGVEFVGIGESERAWLARIVARDN